jgi:hypothetical protein
MHDDGAKQQEDVPDDEEPEPDDIRRESQVQIRTHPVDYARSAYVNRQTPLPPVEESEALDIFKVVLPECLHVTVFAYKV